MKNKIPEDELTILVKQAMSLAIELVDQINSRTPNTTLYCLFSDITASYILAYSYLATYLQNKKANDSYWDEIKKAAHASLDIAFKSIEKNMPIYEEKLKNHANH